MTRPTKFRLGDLLVQDALITNDQLMEALGEQQRSGRKLGKVLIDKGWLTEAQIARAVARQLHAPYVDLAHFPLRPEVAQLLPETAARRMRAIVLDDTHSGLLVGMADPAQMIEVPGVGERGPRQMSRATLAEVFSLGLCTDVIDIFDTQALAAARTKYLAAYSPGPTWRVTADAPMDMFPYLHHALYERAR